jgi:(heptosyl)LPS beta-1,4-glucosyltransferase
LASLSIVLIVKNEAEHLDACLESAAFADDIVVYDSGSTDATLALARRRGARAFQSPDWPGFGAQRRRAQAEARGDWVLMLDADERISPALRTEIQQALGADDRSLAYALPRLSWVFGRFIRHGGWYPDYVVRLYPRTRAGYDTALVHEKVLLAAGMRTVRLKQPLLHFTYRNLHAYLTKSAHYARAWADERAARGKRASLREGLAHGVGCFLRMYLVKAGFLDGPQGLLLALLSAHSTFLKYADLWVRRQKPRP